MRFFRTVFTGVLVCLALPAIGCAYGGAAAAGDNVIVVRNDGFLGGMMRAIYVCKVTDAGLTNCKTSQNP